MATVPVSPAKAALALTPGPGFSAREQAVLAAFATEPGVRDHTVTCARCGTVGRPGWAPIVRFDRRCTVPPLPRAWSLSNYRNLETAVPICDACFGAALDRVLALYRRAA